MTTAPIGHNTDAGQNLRNLVERIERGEEEKREAADAVKEIYAEAKAFGFDTKIIRKIVAERKKPAEERQEEEALLDLYRNALGMLPLWKAAEPGDKAEGEG